MQYSKVMSTTQKLYGTHEAAQELELTDGRIRQICRKGNIGVKVGRDWLLTAKDLEKVRSQQITKKS